MFNYEPILEGNSKKKRLLKEKTPTIKTEALKIPRLTV